MYKEFINYILTETNSDLVITFLSISVTSSILFISISIIPFQQYASSQSIALLKYLKKNKSLIYSYIFIFLIVIILLILPLFKQINLFIYLSLLFTLIIFILIGNAWRTYNKLT